MKRETRNHKFVPPVERERAPIEKCAHCGLFRRTVGILYREWKSPASFSLVLGTGVEQRTLFLYSAQATLAGEWSTRRPACLSSAEPNA